MNFVLLNNILKSFPSGTRNGVDVHLSLFKETEEAQFLWPQDQEGVASAVDASGSSAHPVDVLLWTAETLHEDMNTSRFSECCLDVDLGVVRGVVLDDPVHLRDVQPAGCHICAQQDARVCVAELEEGGGAFGLLLLSLKHQFL